MAPTKPKRTPKCKTNLNKKWDYCPQCGICGRVQDPELNSTCNRALAA